MACGIDANRPPNLPVAKPTHRYAKKLADSAQKSLVVKLLINKELFLYCYQSDFTNSFMKQASMSTKLTDNREDHNEYRSNLNHQTAAHARDLHCTRRALKLLL